MVSLSPGDTGCVPAGTYNEQVRCDAGNGGTAGSYITLRGAAGHGSRITGTSDAVVQIACNYFRFEGFDVAGPSRVGGTNVYPEGGSHHDELVGNWIHGSICQGVSMDSTTSDWVIAANRVYDNGNQPTACDEQAHGLYVEGDRHRVLNNVVYDNHNYGIQRYPEGSNAVIAYNTVAYNGLVTGKSGIVFGRESQSQTMSGDVIVGNIVAFNGGFGIHRGPYAPTSCDIHGNVLFGNPDGGVESGFPAGCVGSNIGANPLFVDGTGRNFHLGAGSSAIDVGDRLFAPPVDFDGVTRPRGAGPDVGGYER